MQYTVHACACKRIEHQTIWNLLTDYRRRLRFIILFNLTLYLLSLGYVPFTFDRKSYRMDLLVGVKKGNREVLKTVYLQYHTRLYRLALRFTNDTNLAEDFVHDIILKLWKDRRKLSTDIPLEAQIIRIARSQIINTLKKRQFRFSMDSVIHAQAEKYDCPTEETEDPTPLTKVYAAINQLPDKCRQILTLNKLEGLTQNEIASYLGISVKTVENQIQKAIQTLKKEFQ